MFASAEFTESLGSLTASEPNLPGHQHGFTAFKVGGGTAVSAPDGQVCLFKERYFHGSRICFDNGATGNLCADKHGGCTGPWNDKIRSILFGAGVSSLLLFDNADFTGPLGSLTASEPNLSDPQHLFTTFRIGGPAPDGQVCFYLIRDFQGPRKCFMIGKTGNFCQEYYGGCGGPWNDKVRSIALGAGVPSLELYDNADFSGFLANLTASEPNLPGSLHRITTFRVGPGPAAPDDQVCFYTRHYYNGRRTCFGFGRNIWPMRASGLETRSILFGSGVQGVFLAIQYSRGLQPVGTWNSSVPTFPSAQQGFTVIEIS